MIIDRLENADLYASVLPGLAAALVHVRTVASDAPDGRIELPDIGGYALVVTYDTEPAHQRKLETHKSFVDLQFVLSGREMTEWTPGAKLEPDVAYDAQKDVAFWKDAPTTGLVMREGDFVLFLPSDAHKPGCSIDPDTPTRVRKVVVKIPV